MTEAAQQPMTWVPQRTARVHALDALRGFAMCGIVFVNILQMSGMPRPSGPSAEQPAAALFELLFFGRFFPIFSFLFGLSFALFLRSAAMRHPRPRLVLLRRIVVLGVIGVLHSLLQPDEVLRFYALFGLVVLLPASYLPRRWVLGAGAILLVLPMVLAAQALFIAGPFVIPGLFLLGMASCQYGVAETLDRRGRQLAWVFAVAVALAGVGGWWQFGGGVGPAHTNRAQIAGVAFALLFAAGFTLLLRTPLGRALTTVFAPIGRLALTNYLLATVLILAGDSLLRLETSTSYGTVVALGVAIGLVQAALSPLWLSRFQYGPAEWVWRCLTWMRFMPLRRGG